MVCGYAVHRCASCDLEFVHPTPSPEAVAAVYASNYFEGGAYSNYFENERKTSQQKAHSRLDTFARLGVTGGALLDLGCAAGYFVDEGLARGFDAYGVEPSERARAHTPARAKDHVLADLDDPRLPQTFDAVTLWDVLEHLPDPVKALSGIQARLAPRGWLGIVVPAIGNVNTRIAPKTWDQYKPPEHLWFWSLSSLTAFLNQHGFDVIHHDVAWQRWSRWVDPDGSVRHRPTRLLRKVDATVHRAAAAVLGRSMVTDSIAVYARARS